MGFTGSESLVLLAKDGTYRIYNVFSSSSSASSGTAEAAAGSYSQHSLAHDVQDSTVSDARIYETGMVLLLSSHQFLEVRGWPERQLASAANPIIGDEFGQSSSYGKGRVERLAEGLLEASPTSWCILTPEQSTSRQVEVLVSAGDALLSIDQLEVQDQRFSRGPFAHVLPSPSGRFMALLTLKQPQKLYVVTSNYAETLSEYDLSNEPEQALVKSMTWCGSNSVVLAWDTSILMVGPYGQTLR